MARALVLALFGIFTAMLGKILGDEVRAWMPWFIEKLLRIAIANLPQDQQQRFSEEWPSHLIEVPGDIGKIITAAGFVFAAQEIASLRKHRRSFPKQVVRRAVDVAVSLLTLLFLIPLIVVIGLITKCLHWRQPVILRQQRIGLQGRPFGLYQFNTVRHNTEHGAIEDCVPSSWWGRFLWQSNLNESPALYNVLRGDISLDRPLRGSILKLLCKRD